MGVQPNSCTPIDLFLRSDSADISCSHESRSGRVLDVRRSGAVAEHIELGSSNVQSHCLILESTLTDSVDNGVSVKEYFLAVLFALDAVCGDLAGLGGEVYFNVVLLELDHNALHVLEVAAVVDLVHHFNDLDLASEHGEVDSELNTDKAGTEDDDFVSDFVGGNVSLLRGENVRIVDSGDRGLYGNSTESGNDRVCSEGSSVLGGDFGVEADLYAELLDGLLLTLDVLVKSVLEGDVSLAVESAAEL